ncbi:hypothetical protein ACFCWL_32230, partial [Streptomyces sp. NPDC056387]
MTDATSASVPSQAERTPLDVAAELVAASFDNPTVPPQSAPRDREPGTLLTAPAPDPTVPEARRPLQPSVQQDAANAPAAKPEVVPAEAEVPAQPEPEVVSAQADAPAAEPEVVTAQADAPAAEPEAVAPEAEAVTEPEAAEAEVVEPEVVTAEADAPAAEAVAETPAAEP